MLAHFELIARVANGIITAGCGLYLSYYFTRARVKDVPTLFWMLGFYIYALEIFLRLWLTFENPLVFFSMTFMFIFFVLGTAILINVWKIFTYITILLTIVMTSTYLAGFWIIYATFGMVFFYGSMSVLTILLRRKFKKFSNFFVIGWMILLFSNLFLLQPVSEAWVDIAAAIGKMMMTRGMVNTHFASLLMMRIRERLSETKPL
ncbi:MAG: hypothetical protein ACE5GD_01985 [Candidatus Geothermarchaeales archaeon]